MRFERMCVVLALGAGLAQAQTFEVASVKVSAPDSQRGSSGGPGSRDPGQYHFNRARLQDLIVVAYHVDGFQVSSKTPLDKDYYDVAAKVPAGATRDEFRLMLQNLLAERFHLKLHHESREFPAYELVVAKNGPKLKEAKVGDPVAGEETPKPKFSPDAFPQLAPNRPGLATTFTTKEGFIVARASAQQQDMAALAQSLSAQLAADSPVVDRTGLTGKYDFQLEYAKAMSAASTGDSPLPDLFAAITRQLGLQLVAKKLPFDVLVIESFDRTPAEN